MRKRFQQDNVGNGYTLDSRNGSTRHSLTRIRRTEPHNLSPNDMIQALNLSNKSQKSLAQRNGTLQYNQALEPDRELLSSRSKKKRKSFFLGGSPIARRKSRKSFLVSNLPSRKRINVDSDNSLIPSNSSYQSTSLSWASNYKGVFWDKACRKYIGSFEFDDSFVEVGKFESEIEAAVAVDEKILSLDLPVEGEFLSSYLNFTTALERNFAKTVFLQNPKLKAASCAWMFPEDMESVDSSASDRGEGSAPELQGMHKLYDMNLRERQEHLEIIGVMQIGTRKDRNGYPCQLSDVLQNILLRRLPVEEKNE
eukprot:snap_masked-scaffold_12-processed-gene-1.38-mRNA-1 protein AED:1.00 eAED:1.00 QI:0/-1/0/0/-1/1/1/0/309